jgi:hypothetical protein
LNAQDEATLRQGADELRAFVQLFEYPKDALRFGSRLMKVAKHTPDLPQKHDAAFLWELMQLGGAYATLDPLHLATSEEEPLKFFLNTLWRAEGEGAIEQGNLVTI